MHEQRLRWALARDGLTVDGDDPLADFHFRADGMQRRIRAGVPRVARHDARDFIALAVVDEAQIGGQMA